MTNIIELAPAHQIQRLVFTSAWGVAETKKDIPGWFRWFIDHSNVRFPYLDHERQEGLVQGTTLNWTSVRPVGLTNNKRTEDITVSFRNSPRPKLTISRLSVARFMLDVVEKNLYPGQMPVISAG
jgi:hypothetical protein